MHCAIQVYHTRPRTVNVQIVSQNDERALPYRSPSSPKRKDAFDNASFVWLGTQYAVDA